MLCYINENLDKKLKLFIFYHFCLILSKSTYNLFNLKTT